MDYIHIPSAFWFHLPLATPSTPTFLDLCRLSQKLQSYIGQLGIHKEGYLCHPAEPFSISFHEHCGLPPIEFHILLRQKFVSIRFYYLCDYNSSCVHWLLLHLPPSHLLSPSPFPISYSFQIDCLFRHYSLKSHLLLLPPSSLEITHAPPRFHLLSP